MIKKFFNKDYHKSFFIIALTLFFTGFSFFNHKLIIQNFGASTFEIYSLIVSLAALLSNFFMVGTRSTFLKLRSDKQQLVNYFFNSFFVVLALSIVSGFFLNYVLINFSNKILSSYSIELQIYIMLQGIVYLISYFLNAINRAISSKIILLSPILFLTFLLSFLHINNIFTLLIYSFILPIMLSMPLVLKYINNSYNKFSFERIFFNNELSYSLKHMISNIIDALSNKMNVIFITFVISDLQEMATYVIALGFTKISSLFSNSVNHVYGPKIADNIFSKDIKGDSSLNDMRIFSIKISFVFLLSFIVFGKYMIEFFYSSIYSQAYQLSIILLIGQFFNSYFNPRLVSLKLAGYAHKMALFKMFTLIIFLLINFYIYEHFGLYSVAISFVLFLNILYNFFVVKIFNFS